MRLSALKSHESAALRKSKWEKGVAKGPFVLASFIQHDDFKIYLCCNMYQHLIFHGWTMFHLVTMLCFTCPFINAQHVWWPQCTSEHPCTSICVSTCFTLVWASVPMWRRPRITCLGVSHAVTLLLICWENTKLPSSAALPLCTPTSTVFEFCFFNTLDKSLLLFSSFCLFVCRSGNWIQL